MQVQILVLSSAACIFRTPQSYSSPSMTAGTGSSSGSATASLPGHASALSATASMDVRRYCCASAGCIHGRFFCQILSRELALDVLMMAVWRRKPDGEVIVHSVQGSQYGSDDWQRFCRANNLAPSMNRRGNSLKKVHIRRRTYKTRDLARADIFDYIEVFYNRARHHSHLVGVSPETFEQTSP